MHVVKIDNLEIEDLIKRLRSGELIIFPSDTVYGLLCDATNQLAVKKLISFKNRPVGKAISIFVSDFKMMKKYVDISGEQEKLLNGLLPGPFTIVLKSKHKACRELESEKGTLGVRIPSYNSINQLIKFFKKPLTATSANLSGRPPHYSVNSLLKEFSERKKKLIDLMINAGKLPHNKTSTVIDLTGSDLKILRRGDLDLKNEKTFTSSSRSQTKKIARFILEKNLREAEKKPLFFIIEGELGVGKTIFAKGLGDFFGIKNIISPSFVISYEYNIKRNFKKFIHVDLYNIEETDEFSHLGLERYFSKGNIICFEWGEKMGELYKRLKKLGKVVYVRMRYVNEEKREITIKN